MTEHYLFQVGHTYIPKNALQKDILKYLSDFDRTIIKYSELSVMKKLFANDIKAICEKHSRCKEITINWHENSYRSKRDLIIYFNGAGICHCGFYYCKTN